MDWKLEVVIMPVTDVDRAKSFYVERVGFAVDHDTRISDDTRIVQLTPPGSACSIVIGTGLGADAAEESTEGAAEGAGSDGGHRPLPGLQLVVTDIEAARSELVERGADVTPVQHYEDGLPVDGPGGPWNSFVFFKDPDGNPWTVQESPGPDGA